MAIILFWVFSGILAYVYVGYPLIVRIWASYAGRPVRRDHLRPTVTVIVSVYNEEKSIRSKIDNILALEYPPDLLDVIVVSDASVDLTDDIVRMCGCRQVRLLRLEGRQGKTACQNHAAVHAAGDVLVFTDATTVVDRRALIELVENFADATVGCVAGSLVYQARPGSLAASGNTTYWGYEIALRSGESKLGTLVGVSGCLYAVRRSAYRPISPELISDFVIAMRIREQGLRTVLEPLARCFEETLDRSHHELSMRVRVAIRSIAALVRERRFLNPFVDPFFAWQLWSHKLLRYASPYCWVVALMACVTLVGDPFYRLALAAHLGLIAEGIAGFLLEGRSQQVGLLRKPYYFLLTNVASFIATVRYVMGERVVTWNPTR